MGLLVPLLLLLVVIWAFAADGNVFRKREDGEPRSLTQTFALTASLLVLAGAVTTLFGVAAVVKAGVGYANLDYSYRHEQYADQTAAADAVEIVRRASERADDLVRGVTLAVVGGILSGAYLAISRAIRIPPDRAAPVARRMTVAFSALCALVGLIALAIGLYTMLQYFIVPRPPDTPREPWGEPLGIAVAFVPAWLASIPFLLRAVRHPNDNADSALISTA